MKLGNLCIAAHNYKNDSFFSNISKLELGDIIKIYDSFGVVLDYEIYDIYKTKQTDLSCTNQDTKSLKVVTLITCDSFDDSMRYIIKAKEKINQGK